MLKLKPNCECCDRDLPPDSRDARICSFECFLRDLRRRQARRDLPELRRRAGEPADPPAGRPGALPGSDRAPPQPVGLRQGTDPAARRNVNGARTRDVEIVRPGTTLLADQRHANRIILADARR